MQTKELINNFREEVKKRGLSDETMSKYNRQLNKIEMYFSEIEFNLNNCQLFLSSIVKKEDFRYVELKKYKYTESLLIQIARYLYFYKYYHYIPITYYGNKKHLDDNNTEILIEYLKFVTKDNKNLNHLSIYKHHFVSFLYYLDKNNLNLKEITINEVKMYLNTFNKFSLSYKRNVSKELKHIIRFLYNNHYIEKDFSMLIPQVRVPKYSNIPSVWKEEEITELLSSFDTSKDLDKRDYAITLLALKLGIRWCDIRNLKFDNINWKNNTINFKQSKTGVALELPLSEEIGLSIIDYIKNARPECNERYIFITNVKPYRQMGKNFRPARKMKNTTFLHKKGIHSLRHTLASNLLKERIPIYIISPILGHVNSNSSIIYLKADEKHLRECYLEIKGVDKSE